MHIFAVNIASEFIYKMSKCPDKINNSHFISLAWMCLLNIWLSVPYCSGIIDWKKSSLGLSSSLSHCLCSSLPLSRQSPSLLPIRLLWGLFIHRILPYSIVTAFRTIFIQSFGYWIACISSFYVGDE